MLRYARTEKSKLKKHSQTYNVIIRVSWGKTQYNKVTLQYDYYKPSMVKKNTWIVSRQGINSVEPTQHCVDGFSSLLEIFQ